MKINGQQLAAVAQRIQEANPDATDTQIVGLLQAELVALGYTISETERQQLYADSIRHIRRKAARHEAAERIEVLFKQQNELLQEIYETPMFDLDENLTVLVPADVRAFHAKLGKVCALEEEIERIALRHLKTLSMPAAVRQSLDAVKTTFKELTEQLAAIDREQQIAARAARRVPDAKPVERKCSACNRKPARIDDLCKKCARAAGIVVHGKV